MPRNTQPQQNFVTVVVGPGVKTGLYYIVVANLAHKTTRQELRTFASQACEVDQAEVYQPTSGFVRVKGRANFERAFEYLNGNMLHHRALQADARNFDQPTVVKLLPTDPLKGAPTHCPIECIGVSSFTTMEPLSTRRALEKPYSAR